MKNIFFSLFAIVFSFSQVSMACIAGNKEAQFIGHVINLKVVSAAEASGKEYYTFNIDFTYYEPSAVCPMNEENAYAATLKYEGAPLVHEGQEISGVLVYSAKSKSYFIDYE